MKLFRPNSWSRRKALLVSVTTSWSSVACLITYCYISTEHSSASPPARLPFAYCCKDQPSKPLQSTRRSLPCPQRSSSPFSSNETNEMEKSTAHKKRIHSVQVDGHGTRTITKTSQREKKNNFSDANLNIVQITTSLPSKYRMHLQPPTDQIIIARYLATDLQSIRNEIEFLLICKS